MISLRYHVVSLLAVLLALAVGIALGSGPLQTPTAQVSASVDEPGVSTETEDRLLEQGSALANADAFAAASADRLLAGALDGRSVALVALPGADPATVDAVSEAVLRAGGRVTSRLSVTERLLDVADRQLVAELASQMAAASKRAVEVPRRAEGYDALGILLAHALISDRPGAAAVGASSRSVLAGLEAADLAEGTDEVAERASLALVVAGDPYGSADERSGAGTILGSLLLALDAGGGGVVLAGPPSSASSDGLVYAVRSDARLSRTVSTVDIADRPAGAVATGLALAAEAAGRSGHWGSTASADGALPPPPPVDR